MVSVVVPVYNVKDYLHDCVVGILGQTFSDIEIILVDDGSTDGSGELCDNLAKTDDRIRVIHKANGGLMSAWKAGVNISSGEYIGFVDSDDYIDSDMFEKMYAAASKYKADVVAVGLIREYDRHTEKEDFFLEGGYYSRSDIEDKIYPIMVNQGNMLNRGLSPNKVTKLIKTELIKANLEFCDERVSLGEDLVTTFAVMSDAKSIVVLNDFFPYHYKIRGSSIMGTCKLQFFEQTLLLHDILAKIADKKQVYNFKSQLINDFISLCYYGIENNVASGELSNKEIKNYIKKTVCSNEFKSALKSETLSDINKKCLIYKAFINLHLYGLLSWFIKNIVVATRKKRGR